MDRNAIEIVDLSLVIEGHKIFAGLNFVVPGASALLVSGSNGSGKTSLLNVLSGFRPPSAGRMIIFGETVRRYSALSAFRHGLTRSFQNPVLMEEHTALENVLVGRRLFRPWLNEKARCTVWDTARRESRWRREATDLLSELGLGGKSSCKASLLSAGERRRVDLSRALFSGAKIFLLDEPLANLDGDIASRMIDTFDRFAEAGHSFIIVEHRLRFFESAARWRRFQMPD